MAFNVGAVYSQLKADITHFKNGIDKAKDHTEGLKKSLSKVGDSIQDFGKKAAIVGAAVGAGLTVIAKKAIEMAGNFEQSEIAFTTLLKDREKAIAAIKAIEEDAKKTPYNLPDLIKANQLLISAGVNTEDARDQIKYLGNAIAATGGGTAELNRMVVNLQQVKALGKASALDVKQFAYAGINIYKLLAEATGKNVKEVKEMDITYELLIDSLKKASETGGMFEGAMEAQSKSFQGLKENISDVIGITLKDIAVKSGLFDAIKNGAQGVLTFIETAGPVVSNFFQKIGNIFKIFKEALSGDNMAAEFAEELIDILGKEEAKMVGDVLQWIADAFRNIGNWIADNQELVLTFLEGFGVALGVLLIISTVIGLLNALFNPLTLIILTVVALYTAWKTNFWGIRDITNEVWNFLKNLFENYLAPLVNWLREFIEDRWWAVKIATKLIWDIISTVIRSAFQIISGIFTFMLGILSGDWRKAWEGIKKIVSGAWTFISGIFSGMITFITGWGSSLWDKLTEPFRKAWETIQDIVQKIKDALDFTKRHSPSVIDIVTRGVRLTNEALEGLDFGGLASPQLAAATVSQGGSKTQVTQVTVSLDGAIIGSSADAEELGEKIGDSIVKRLQENVRF